jgi:hypothetical protein
VAQAFGELRRVLICLNWSRMADRQIGKARFNYLEIVLRGMDSRMDQPNGKPASPIRRHAADALRRARRLPIGHARNDLRQLAIGLLWLERRGFIANAEDGELALSKVKETRL